MAIKHLGKYEIIDRLGRGGMAEVYRGYQTSLERYVAIKLLHPFLADDPEFKDRFEREARNVARLRHPNIVQVYDFEYDTNNESYYMVMELIDGQTLKDYLSDLHDKGERMSMREIVRIARGAISALAYAHARGMIHRDVKPANLMLDSDGRLVLTDFGIAKIVTGIQFTASGGLIGTPAYMAPEQGLGEAGDERSDLYSFGVILFQMCTGELPFDAEAPLAVILKHLNQPIPSIHKLNPNVPDAMAAVVYKTMAKDPDERYQTADELLKALDDIELDPTKSQRSPDMAALSALTTATDATATAASVTSRADSLTTSTNPALITPPPINLSPATPEALPTPTSRPSAAGIGGLIVIGLLAVVGVVLGGGQLLGALKPTPTVTPTVTAPPTASSTVTITPTASWTLTSTLSPSPTATITSSATSSPTATATLTPSATETSTPSPTATPTATATATVTASNTATPTPTFTPSVTPSPTVNFTATIQAVTLVAQNKTATSVYATLNALVLTQSAGNSPTPDYTGTALTCQPQYLIVQPKPTLAPIPADSDFQRTITLRNTGDCDWLPGMYLQFHDGEKFSAPIKIIANEQVPIKPGDLVTFNFIGHTPKRGGNYTGTWEVRLSPDNRLLTPLLPITFFAYE